MHEREREVQAPAHAARVAADAPIGGVGEADALEQLVAAPTALGLGRPCSAALQLHVLAGGEEVVQRGVLERGADDAPHLRALARRRRTPPRSRVPAVGGSSVVSMCTVVDLPAPLGPRKP